MRYKAVLLLVACALAGGCDVRAGTAVGPEGQTVTPVAPGATHASQPTCAPGATQACLCSTGQTGAQSCSANGSQWEGCACKTASVGAADPAELRVKRLVVVDESGKDRVLVEMAKVGPRIVLVDNEGRPRVTAGVFDNSPLIFIMDAEGHTLWNAPW